MQLDDTNVTLIQRRQAQRRLRLGLVLLVVTTGVLILTVLFIGSARRVENLRDSLLVSTTERTEVELARFFEPVRAGLGAARRWAEQGLLDPADADGLTARFQPMLESWPQVTSMMVADPNGAEFMLLRLGDAWTTRVVAADSGGRDSAWRRWANGATPETWSEDIDYDPRARPWYLGASGLTTNDDVHWTEPYTFFTTNDPGLTAATRSGPLSDEATRLLAFDVLLTSISAFTVGLDVTPNGFVVVLTDDDRVLGLPRDERFRSGEARTAAVLSPAQELGLPVLARGLEEWHRLGGEPTSAMPFDVGGEAHWAGMQPVDVSGRRLAWIGVFVPEADFLGGVRTEHVLVLAILAVALMLGIVLATIHSRKVREEVKQAVARARRLGQYTLVRKLGAGGMGTVYLARHSMLRRPTAVKLISTDDPAAVGRFEREVQATASLAHPHTIAIYDYGRTPDGTFYYAMEYLAGVDLAQLVRRDGPMPAGRLIAVLVQVCESLAEAHDRGLIHRDIKPANVMLCRYGGTPDFAKVLDFGLVKESVVAEGGNDGDLGLTRTTEIKGTPYYLSPEAIEAPLSVDARSDIYSLGASAYFLVTGEPVFEGKSAMLLLSRHVSEPPVPPSQRGENPVPADLERVILDCLAKSPDDRPQTVRALRSRLLACAAAGSWTEDDADGWWRREESEHTGAEAGVEAGAPIDSGDPAATLTVDLGSRAAGSDAGLRPRS